MARKQNTNREGYSWSDATKLAVWMKGEVIPNYSSDVWRWDKCGLVMKFSEHGNRNSDVGWEIDHVNPVSNGGSDYIDNLQHLNWANNLDKADNLYWSCPKR